MDRPAETPRAETDDVVLSPSAQQVEKAAGALAALPDVKMEKIEEIKPRLEDGTYRVQSEVVARRMVDASIRESARLKKPRRG